MGTNMGVLPQPNAPCCEGRRCRNGCVCQGRGGHTSLSPVCSHLSHCRVIIRHFTESTTKTIVENDRGAPVVSVGVSRHLLENAATARLGWHYFKEAVIEG